MSDQSAPPSAPVANNTPAPSLEDSLRQKAQTAEVLPAKKDFLGPKFAALTRKEKEVREKEKQFEAKMAALSEKETKYSTWEQQQANPENDWKYKLKSNPLEALKEAGMSIEDIVEAFTLDANPTPEMLIKRQGSDLTDKFSKELEALKAQLADRDTKEAEMSAAKEREQYENVVGQFKKSISEHVSANADTYELVLANNATDLIFTVIEDYHKETNRVLSVEDAAKAVESHLEDEAKKIFELKKFKTASEPKPGPQPKSGAPTLSNTLSAQVPERADKTLSREERLARSAKLLKFNE